MKMKIKTNTLRNGVLFILTAVLGLVISAVLMGGVPQQPFDEFFKEHSKQYKEQSLKVLFTDTRKQNTGQALALLQLKGTGSVGLEYFEVEKGGHWDVKHFQMTEEWQYKQNARLKFNKKNEYRVMEGKPHYYAGTLQDNNIESVYVGNQKADIVSVDKEARVWYIVGETKNIPVTAHYKDGSKKELSEIVDVK